MIKSWKLLPMCRPSPTCLIVKSLDPLRVGETFDARSYFVDSHGNPCRGPFTIVQEVSQDAYLRECQRMRTPQGIILTGDHFYRIWRD